MCVGFLQLKDQIHQGSAQKSSVSAIKSLLLPNLLQVKLRRIFADPTLKSITDLHRNLELVYVGHACLSWEILHWQYRKAMEMLEDEDGEGNTSSYNHVAGEFQQFRVLLDRFVENEPFQGPRVQTYAQNRCDIRSILQVPVIKGKQYCVQICAPIFVSVSCFSKLSSPWSMHVLCPCPVSRIHIRRYAVIR